MSFNFPKGRYLVTGGAGFLGSHLCEALLERGCEVICADNYITGRSGNLKTLLSNSLFEFVKHDIVKPLEVSGALRGIFHLASPASPIDYDQFPLETLRVGSIGSDNVLNLALSKDCPILVSSTSEVYGDPLEHPQKESYWGNVNSVGPRSCYDEAKRYLEALTIAYHRKYDVDTKIIRIFNTYGPRMRTDDGRVVPNFCIQALTGKDITVNGEGKQTRSFCYVSDLIEGILRAFCHPGHLPINLGNPVEFTVIDFAHKIIELTRSRSKIIFRSMPVDDPKTRCPDISLAKELLGWTPNIRIDEGLKLTIEYFKSTIESV